MAGPNYAAKYDELGGLLKRYCDHRKRQTKSLQEQLKEEVSTNLELRKYIVFLEGKLQVESENSKRLALLLDDREKTFSADLMERERHLHSHAAELELRLRIVQQREQECAEFSAALNEREQRHWADTKLFQRSKELFEAELAASKRTVQAELQHSRCTEDSLPEVLDDVSGNNTHLLVQGCYSHVKARYTEPVLLLERDEGTARLNLLGTEMVERESILCNFFSASATCLNDLLAEQQEREKQLRHAEDLLHLQQVDLAGRMRKEEDLQRDRHAQAKMQRKVLAMQCRRVLRGLDDVLGSLPGLDAEAVMLELESRIQGILQVTTSFVVNE